MLVDEYYTGAAEAPGSVRAEVVSSTEISVLWTGLTNCRLVNGHIVSYRVQYTTNGTTEIRDQEVGNGNDWRCGGRTVLTGLTPRTNYSIAVATVNGKGDIGLYSDPVTQFTLEASKALTNTLNKYLYKYSSDCLKRVKTGEL